MEGEAHKTWEGALPSSIAAGPNRSQSRLGYFVGFILSSAVQTMICYAELTASPTSGKGGIAPNIVYRDDLDITNYVALAARPEYQCVLALSDLPPANPSVIGNIRGSCVLISPNWALTAGHCVWNDEDGLLRAPDFLGPTNYNQFYVRLEGTAGGTNALRWQAPNECFFHPEASWYTGVGNGYDIALFRLTPSAGSLGEQLLTNYQPAILYQGNDEIGQVGTWVGYGACGTALEGDRRNPPAKLAAQNMIDGSGESIPFLGVQQDIYGRWYIDYQGPWTVRQYYGGPFGSSRELASDFDSPYDNVISRLGLTTPLFLEGGLGAGDSGGGMFINVDNTNYLVGINSYTLGDSNVSPVPRGYGSYSAATRVTAFRDWINDHIFFAAFQSQHLTSGSNALFRTPTLWMTGSPTNYQAPRVPGPQHCAVFNSAAVASVNSLCDNCNYWPVPVQRATYSLTLDTDWTNARVRVRRGTDVTLDLGGSTYTLASTSAATASLVVGQAFSDSPVLTITNGILNCFSANIAEWGDTPVINAWQYYKDTCSGIMNLHGSGTRLNITDNLYIGGRPSGPGGQGLLNVADGAQLNVGNTLTLWYVATFCNWYIGCGEILGQLNLDNALVSAGSLDVAGGLLTGNGNVDIAGKLIWRGGVLAGCGSIDARGGIDIRGGEVLNRLDGTVRALVLDGRTITNHGAATWRGAIGVQGLNGATIVNLDEATFEVKSEGSLSGSNAFIHNLGLLKKSDGTNVTIVEWAMNNEGTIEVQTNTLRLQGAILQVSNNTLGAGTWVIHNGARLELNTADVLTNQGTVNLDGPFAEFPQFTHIVANEGQWTLENGRMFTTSSNLVNSGTISISAGSALFVNGDFEQGPHGILNVNLSKAQVENALAPINIASEGSLHGALRVAVPAGAALSEGEVIPVLNCASARGAFESVTVSIMGHVTCDLVYSTNSIGLMILTVPQPLRITSASIVDNNLVLTWTGSNPDYVLEVKTNLADVSWTPIWGPTDATNALVPFSTTASFYRVLGKQ